MRISTLATDQLLVCLLILPLQQTIFIEETIFNVWKTNSYLTWKKICEQSSSALFLLNNKIGTLERIDSAPVFIQNTKFEEP